MRLAVFVDQVFWVDGNRLTTNESFALFFEQFVGHVEHIVFVARQAPEPGQGPFLISADQVSLLPIPFYESLFALWRVPPSRLKAFRQRVLTEATTWDAMLLSGPHPIGQWIARDLEKRGVPVIPILRQNMPNIMASYPGMKGLVAQCVARLLEYDFKRLASQKVTLTVGGEMTEAYSRVSNHVSSFMPCLVDNKRFAQLASNTHSSSINRTRLITVGRLAPEKGHSTLVSAIRLLKDRGISCHLDIVGDGPLQVDIIQKLEEEGVQNQVTMHGFVPYGEALFELYTQAAIAVVPSSTEGFPQVLNESLSAGLATVASAVGGIPHFLTHDKTALLVEPKNPKAFADALQRLIENTDLYQQVARAGQQLMRKNTLEHQRAVVLHAVNAAATTAAKSRR